MSVRQAIDYLSGAVGKTLLYDLVAKGRIASTRLGGKILIDRHSLDRLLDSNRKGEQVPPPEPPPERRRSQRQRRRASKVPLW
jgi:excisionase family DNA binding protein